MLDTETKRRIDSCRDILVGKVPDPKSQVEQITIALIYKFMSDMDAESVELGGKCKFFSADFRKFDWPQLMAANMGGHDVLNLYSEAIASMNRNTGLPELFRDIFKNAFLPYRDPETLRAFLKEINTFSYDHSEKLGDAFEYLLSVLGSQGDAGQFRTPRHIIDFMVEVIDPKKNESILDPACGTAGFLISSYKHIRAANTKKKPGDKLTADDRKRIVQNIRGYDISPDMVRLSLVNLYLHGFAEPHIEEYDTLTSEEKWTELADVVLANPPFMSPKGGIKPHKRFSIQAKRSEVLFVDYIAEHLTPTGRAAVIVPEGIIFQSGTAYKALRKMLVENSLVAVVSLPAGVFQPYSGVKTSILVMDKRLAKKRDDILFVKIENDGYGLGAQRREVSGEQLTEAAAVLKDFFGGTAVSPTSGAEACAPPHIAHAVPKKQIAENGEYNLSGERYKTVEVASSSYPIVEINEVISTTTPPNKIQKSEFKEAGRFPVIDQSQQAIAGWTDDESALVNPSQPVVVFGDHTCAVKLIREPFAQGADGIKIIDTKPSLLPEYLFWFLITHPLETDGYKRHFSALKRKKIPLPPLAVQQELVAEIEGYQKIIDGARAVLENYRPHIPIHPDWPMVELGTICSFKNGLNYSKSSDGHALKIIGVSNFKSNLYVPVDNLDAVNLDAPVSKDYLVKKDDILFVRSNGNPDLVGRSIIMPSTKEPVSFSGFTIRGRIIDKRALPLFFAHFFKSRDFAERIKTVGRGANIRNLSQGILRELKIPLPPLETQEAVVAEIEAEQRLVESNRELIRRFEEKTRQTIARVWGESE